MDGHTTVEEEERLTQYFRTGDVPEEWSKYKEMFAFFDEEMPRGRYDETPPESNVPEASQQEVKLVKKNSRKPFIALWSTVSATASPFARHYAGQQSRSRSHYQFGGKFVG